MSHGKPTLLWFRNDLRLADNAALAQAIAAGGPVIPVFVWAPKEAGNWSPGAASRWWLHQALVDLGAQWQRLGGDLVLRWGGSLEVLRGLIEETGAARVYWNRRYEAPLREVDLVIARELRQAGIEVGEFNSSLLNEPVTVSTNAGQPYKVYTPYWNKVKDRPLAPVVMPQLASLRFPETWPASLPLVDFGLLPEIPWDRGFYARWNATEAGAMERLEAFLSGPVEDYAVDRDRPDHDGTSCLSPYLHWGQIGPRQIVDRLCVRADLNAPGPQTFLKELYWREFAYNVLYHFPATPDHPLRGEYADFPWERGGAVLRLWQDGRTGYPIVDAGMRQLWQTGWMHNRVRMIVASFLVKHLLHDWHDGAKWFWEALVDADLANNTLGWQWSGGCGADAAPYFRIFNPIIQGRKFDPEGNYVRRFVPELAKLETEYIHSPWEAPDEVLRCAEVTIGETYPEPIIDHKAGRERALAALDRFKQ